VIRFATVYGVLAVIFGWFAAIELRRYPVGPVESAALYGCLLLLLGLYLAPGFPATRAWLIPRVRWWWLGSFLLPYFLYVAGTGDFRWLAFAKVVILAFGPLGIFLLAPVRNPKRLNWQDIVVLLWLMVPVLTGWIAGIWTKPVNLDFMTRLFLVAVGAWSFIIIRGIENSGYEFTYSPVIARDALLNFLGFTVIALPLGLGLRFIGWNPHWRGVQAFFFDYVTIFLFIAVTEELFFRGLIQNLLEGSTNSRYGAQAVTAVLFGMSHILHAPFPNWRYVALATIAGWFYGSAYRKRRSLMASATTHALVDTLWRTFLTMPR
jgi:membrane protease YdiL (CAAX protease family)